MAATSTLNVRLPEDLKERGMQVLAREGVSISELVRDLFYELEETQELPEFAKSQERAVGQAEIQRKRDLLRSLAGITSVPAGLDAREAYREHLEWKHRPGVRS